MLIAALLTGALGACTSDPDEGSDESSTTTTTEATTTTADEGGPTTTADIEGSIDPDLVGTWTADASAILAANTVNVGGAAGMECSGPINMRFNDTGTMSRFGSVTCSLMGQSASLTINSSASWAVTEPGTLTISEVVDLSTMDVGGAESPYPDSFGGGDALYSVDFDGNTLTIHFNIDPAGPITQEYTRS